MRTQTYLLLFLLAFTANAAERPRMIVLTDIENEPGDAESMVRFMTYSNQWDVEALIATTSGGLAHTRNRHSLWQGPRQPVET